MSACAAGFFQSPKAWRQLETQVIEPLVASCGVGASLRLWSAACGTGEDACALAILLHEAVEKANSNIGFQVFATDIPPNIERASAAAYPARAMRGLSPDRRRSWFEPTDRNWRLKQSLRRRLVFARHDLLSDPGFRHIDIAACRGVAAFCQDEQACVLRELEAALNPGGVLFLGESVTLPDGSGFEPLHAAAGLYRKPANVKFAQDLKADAAASHDRWQSIRLGGDESPHLARLANAVDELKASREELYALNRELLKVNLRLSQTSLSREAKIRQLEMQRNMLASGELIAVFVDHDLRIQWFTPATTELFPIRESDIGRPLTELVPRFEGAAFLQALQQVRESGQARTTELCGANGRWYVATVRLYEHVPAMDSGLSAAFADITAQKRAQEELLSLNAHLEQCVQEEVLAREQAMAQLAQAEKLAAIGQLAGGIAHDFNNILQAIATSAEVMNKRSEDAQMVKRASGLQTKATERGAAITRRLLSFARRADLHPQPIDVGVLLLDVREMLAATLGPHIRIVIEAEAGLPPASADRGQFETALVNLAANSRDAMEAGGDLTFRARRETLPHGPPAAGDYVRIDVADTGAGMDAATLSRASEPFFTTKPVGKGTGLGLSMARGFAEQSGGAFQVASEPGRGTEVTLWLPVAQSRQETRAAEPVSAAPLKPARVLLVDDEAMIAELLTDVLRAHGLEVTMATAGAEARSQLAGDAEFDLLVSDLSMPEVSGLDVARAARAQKPELPIIILTGNTCDPNALELERHLGGAIAFLRKPIAGDALIDAIRRLAPPA